MTDPGDPFQRIAILTPAAEIVARLTSLSPVSAQDVAPERSIGATLAADVLAPCDMPKYAAALQDGWAVASDRIAGASAYAPALLSASPLWVNAGEAMPAGTDTVLHADAVKVSASDTEVLASASPGEGVLPPRSEAANSMILFEAGNCVDALTAAILRALTVASISVRAPRVKILALSVREASADSIGPVIANAVRAHGGIPEIICTGSVEAAPDHDAMITIGGTGSGKNDTAVKSLSRLGTVHIHGFGISPGQTSALGSIGGRPVLMLPGRLDAALAVFLLVGAKLLSQLSGSRRIEAGLPLPLARKVSSPIGLTDVVFVRRKGDGIEPLGNGFFFLHALMRADGYIVVPAESEGHAAGTMVEMKSLP